MKTLAILLVLALGVPSLGAAKAKVDCEKQEGYWNSTGQKDPYNYLRIEQTGCDEIALTRVHRVYTSAKKEKSRTYKRSISMKLNGEWTCTEGDERKLICGNATLNEKGKIKITRTWHEVDGPVDDRVSCLTVAESFFEHSTQFRTDSVSKCSGLRASKSMSRIKRVTVWKEK